MESRGKHLAIWGIVLQAAPLVGISTTVVGMVRAFREIQTSDSTDAAALSGHIYLALIGTAVGLMLALVGAVLILIALWGTRYRAPWFYTALWVVSILWLLNIPIGTILGIVVIVYLLNHRQEFVEPRMPMRDAVPEA